MNRVNLSVLLLALCATACGDTNTSAKMMGCSNASDCPGDLVCVSGQCVLPQCTVDQECQAGLQCIEFRCRFIEDANMDAEVEDPGPVDATVETDTGSNVDRDAASTADTALPDRGIADTGSSVTDQGAPDVDPFEFDLAMPGPDAQPDAEVDAIRPDMATVPECEANIDCAEDRQCEGGLCRLRCDAANAEPCDEGDVCHPELGRCQPALACEPECDAGFRCDPIEGRCVAEDVDPLPCEGPCPAGQRCDDASDACVIVGCIEDGLGINSDADTAAPLPFGRTQDLALCTERDWFILDFPGTEDGEPATLRVSANYQPQPANLELSLYREDFVAGQRPLAEATTDRNPEVLTVDALQPGRYVLAVSAFVVDGALQPAIEYELEVAQAEHGFCTPNDECPEGFRCEEERCVIFVDPCAGQCGPLEVCDPELAACLAQCDPDVFGGENTDRASASDVQFQRYQGLTRCEGESDWYRVEIPRAGTLVVSVQGEGDRFRNDVHIELWGAEPPPANPDPEAPPPEPLRRSAFAGELFEQIEYRFDDPTVVFVRVYGGLQSRYALNLSLGSACDFDWDCCEPGEGDCHRRCDGLAGVCVDEVCGVDFECDGRLVCDAAGRACVVPACIDDGFGGLNQDLESAVQIPARTQLEGLVTCDRGEDWFRVELGAGDGIDVEITFEDDGFASYDLELHSDDGVLHESISATDNEALAYNVDEAGNYYIRVFGALEGRYDLRSDVVAGGIDVIPCDERNSCGLNRLCQPGEPSRCVSRTCLGEDANVVCDPGFECAASGECVCEARDQFEEVNTSPADAVRLGDGFNAELTLCGSEDDWFVLNVAELTVAELRFNTEDDGGLAVDILDSDLFPQGAHRVFGQDRILLDEAAGEIYVVISANGAPRSLAYEMSVGGQ